MARTVNHDYRQALVEAVASQFVVDGTSRASLRDLADAVGVSARMLVHHFGTREQLVESALAVAREHQLAAARAAIVPGPDAAVVLREVWTWFARADTRQYFALFTEVAALERTAGVGDRQFDQRFRTDWAPLLEPVFAADQRFADDASALALLVLGVLRGFALDLASDVDLADHRRAFNALVELVAARGR